MKVKNARQAIDKCRQVQAYVQYRQDCGQYIKISKATAKSLLDGLTDDDFVNFLWITGNTLLID